MIQIRRLFTALEAVPLRRVRCEAAGILPDEALDSRIELNAAEWTPLPIPGKIPPSTTQRLRPSRARTSTAERASPWERDHEQRDVLMRPRKR